jgi:hypothetical protein
MRLLIPLFMLCVQAATAAENLIENGGFESPSFPIGTHYHPPIGSLGAWQTTGPGELLHAVEHRCLGDGKNIPGVLLSALDHDLVMDGRHDMRLLRQPPV